MSPAPPPGGLGGSPPTEGGGPLGYYAPPAELASRPAVILWFRVFAIVSAAVYGSAAFVWAAFAPNAGVSPHVALVGLAAALPFLVFYGVAAAVPYKPWGWTYALLAIAFGIVSCLAPFSVILVLLWRRPEVKAAFQRL